MKQSMMLAAITISTMETTEGFLGERVEMIGMVDGDGCGWIELQEM